MAVRFNHHLLRTVRLDLGLSQEEAARTLGVDVRTYRRYESGEVNAGLGHRSFDVRTASRRQLLRKMCEELGVARLEDWLVEAGAETAPDEAREGLMESRHVLVPAQHFVGRKELLRELEDWAASPMPGVFAIVGVGGMGKTAVAERFVHAHHNRVWLHAFYDDPRVEPAVLELNEASESPSTERGERTREMRETRAGAAGRPESIVVLDGLEAVQSSGGGGRAFGEIEEPALRRVLRAVASGMIRRKVLVTSRFPLSDLASWENRGLVTHPLAPLSTAEACRVLRAWGLLGDDTTLATLAERVGGHALSIAVLGSYGAFLGGDPARATPPPDAGDDDPIARRLGAVLDAYASAIGDDERQVLAHLSIFAGAANVGLLARVVERSEQDVLRAVGRLVRLGLAGRTERGVSAHPFVRERFRRLLGDRRAAAHDAARRAITASLADRPDTQVAEPDLLEAYEELFLHTLGGGDRAAAWGIYVRALGGFGNLGLRLGEMSLGARVLGAFAEGRAPSALVGGADASAEGLPAEIRARILYDWALYAGALGDLDLAARTHDAHLEVLRMVHPDVGAPAIAMALRTRAYVAWLAGDLPLATRSITESLGVARAIREATGSIFHEVRGEAFAAWVAHARGDSAAVDEALARAHALEPIAFGRRALWEAEIRLDRGALEPARALADHAAKDAHERGWPGHVAHAETVLGLVAVTAGDEPAAREHLARARRWVEQSNEVEVALRCWALATRLGETGARQAGHALATTHGFGAFRATFARE